MPQKERPAPRRQNDEPSIAPGMDMDELEESASEQEIANHDYTEVSKLFVDRLD